MSTWYERLIEKRRAEGKFKIILDREDKELYIERFYICSRWWTLGLIHPCIHIIHKSDNIEDGLHDHPWLFWISFILKGCYIELRDYGKGKHITNCVQMLLYDRSASIHNYNYEFYKTGSINFGGCLKKHNIQKVNNVPVYSLFIMGPKVPFYDWGFFPKDTNEKINWKLWLLTRSKKNGK